VLGDDYSFCWEKYTRLLRTAWLNRSDRKSQLAVLEYEDTNAEFLNPLFNRWQILANKRET